MNEWMNEWMNEEFKIVSALNLNNYMSLTLIFNTITKNEWMNQWMNEWMNQWMNEWMNEWMRNLKLSLLLISTITSL